MAKIKQKKITSFDLPKGKIIAKKFEVMDLLGSGWEGEVYRVIEIETGIERAAKLYYPHRNIKNKHASICARKVDLLANCPIIIRYHTQDIITIQNQPVTCIISEFCDGEILSEFIARQQGGRISIMQGLILLHSLTKGLESMHRMNEYHGDLHSENILIKRYGLGFELKLLDLHHWGDSKKANIAEDLCNSIRIFYDAIGGAPRYPKQPIEVKEICLGLKKTLILKKFRNTTELKKHLENIVWQSSTRV